MVMRARVVLRAQAARSLLAGVVAAILGVAIDGARPDDLALSVAIVTGLITAWAFATRPERRRRLLERSRIWEGDPPQVVQSPTVVRRALVPVPVAAGLVWLGSQASRLYADDTAVLLGGLVGLVASLGVVRLMLAFDVARWEAGRGHELLLSEAGLRSTTTVWAAPLDGARYAPR